MSVKELLQKKKKITLELKTVDGLILKERNRLKREFLKLVNKYRNY